MKAESLRASPDSEEIQIFFRRLAQEPALLKDAIRRFNEREDRKIDPMKWVFDFLRTVFSILFGRAAPSVNADATSAAKDFVAKNSAALNWVKGALADKESSRIADQVWEGKVIDFGRAPHLFDRANEESYYVILKKSDGNTETIWGKELKDAISDTEINVGDYIKLLCQCENQSVPMKTDTSKGASRFLGTLHMQVTSWHAQKIVEEDQMDDESSFTMNP
jgi:hypothetical protein